MSSDSKIVSMRAMSSNWSSTCDERSTPSIRACKASRTSSGVSALRANCACARMPASGVRISWAAMDVKRRSAHKAMPVRSNSLSMDRRMGMTSLGGLSTRSRETSRGLRVVNCAAMPRTDFIARASSHRLAKISTPKGSNANQM